MCKTVSDGKYFDAFDCLVTLIPKCVKPQVLVRSCQLLNKGKSSRSRAKQIQKGNVGSFEVRAGTSPCMDDKYMLQSW